MAGPRRNREDPDHATDRSRPRRADRKREVGGTDGDLHGRFSRQRPASPLPPQPASARCRVRSIAAATRSRRSRRIAGPSVGSAAPPPAGPARSPGGTRFRSAAAPRRPWGGGRPAPRLIAAPSRPGVRGSGRNRIVRLGIPALEHGGEVVAEDRVDAEIRFGRDGPVDRDELRLDRGQRLAEGVEEDAGRPARASSALTRGPTISTRSTHASRRFHEDRCRAESSRPIARSTSLFI